MKNKQLFRYTASYQVTLFCACIFVVTNSMAQNGVFPQQPQNRIQSPLPGKLTNPVTEFLENSENVIQLQFRIKPTLSLAGIDEEGFQHYHAKYQDSGFVLHQIRPANNVTNALDITNSVSQQFMALGAYGGRYWLFQGGNIQISNVNKEKVDTDPVYQMVAGGKSILDSVLNLGIKDVPFGEIKMIKDKFSYLTKRNTTITGSIVLNEGVTTGWNLNYDGFSYRLEYEYNRSLPLGLPNEFAMRLEGSPVPNMQVEVLSFELMERPFPPTAFELGMLLPNQNEENDYKVINTILHTNGIIGLAQPDGSVKQLAEQNTVAIRFDIERRRRIIIWILGGLSLSAIIFIAGKYFKNFGKQTNS